MATPNSYPIPVLHWPSCIMTVQVFLAVWISLLEKLLAYWTGPKTNWIVGTKATIGLDSNTVIIDKLTESGEVSSKTISDRDTLIPPRPYIRTPLTCLMGCQACPSTTTTPSHSHCQSRLEVLKLDFWHLSKFSLKKISTKLHPKYVDQTLASKSCQDITFKVSLLNFDPASASMMNWQQVEQNHHVDTILLKEGKQMTWSDVSWLALYCRKVNMLFMSINIPSDFESRRWNGLFAT